MTPNDTKRRRACVTSSLAATLRPVGATVPDKCSPGSTTPRAKPPQPNPPVSAPPSLPP